MSGYHIALGEKVPAGLAALRRAARLGDPALLESAARGIRFEEAFDVADTLPDIPALVTPEIPLPDLQQCFHESTQHLSTISRDITSISTIKEARTSMKAYLSELQSIRRVLEQHAKHGSKELVNQDRIYGSRKALTIDANQFQANLFAHVNQRPDLCRFTLDPIWDELHTEISNFRYIRCS